MKISPKKTKPNYSNKHVLPLKKKEKGKIKILFYQFDILSCFSLKLRAEINNTQSAVQTVTNAFGE